MQDPNATYEVNLRQMPLTASQYGDTESATLTEEDEIIARNKTIFDERLAGSIKRHPPGYPPLKLDGLGSRRPSEMSKVAE